MKKNLFLLFFLFQISITVKAINQQRIDSLQKIIEVSPDDSNKVNLYFKLARQFDQYSSKNHIKNYILGLELAKKIHFTNGCIKIYKPLVTLLYYKNMLESSFNYCLEYIDFCDKNDLPEQKKTIYNLMGNLLVREGKFGEAKKYYVLTKEDALKNENFKLFGSTLNNMTLMFMEMNELDSAALYSQQATEMFQKNNMRSEQANSTLGSAEIFMMKKDFEKAKEYALRSYDLYTVIHELHGICNAQFVLGQLEMQFKKPKEAIRLIENSLKIADSLNLNLVKRDCYKYLSQIHAEQKEFQQAYDYNVLWKKYNDSLGIDQQKGKMLEAEVKFELAKTEHLLNERDFEIENKNRQRNFLFLGLAATALLLLISFRAYSQKKRSNQLISEQKKLVEEKNHEITDSINYAKKIQYTLLAHQDLLKDNLPDHFVLFKPKDIVSGDFYWASSAVEKFYLAVCDSTGHGVPGAFMSLLNISFLAEAINEKKISEPNKVFDFVRMRLLESVGKEGQQDGFDGILLCIERTGDHQLKISYAAANNAPILIRENKVIELSCDKMPVGPGVKNENFSQHNVEIKKGDTLYMYTDGYADQFGGPKGKKYKYKQLNELLCSNTSKDSQTQKSILEKSFLDWKGDLEQVDDVLLIGIKF
ncbi:MAG TPA: SpoIIE family protein phosphatase [Bacteroidia bacterium]|nr:SpoIIE family protein phosphatase [Bacteroidia bacterium]